MADPILSVKPSSLPQIQDFVISAITKTDPLMDQPALAESTAIDISSDSWKERCTWTTP